MTRLSIVLVAAAGLSGGGAWAETTEIEPDGGAITSSPPVVGELEEAPSSAPLEAPKTDGAKKGPSPGVEIVDVRTLITPDEFRAEFEGKTIHLRSGDLYYGSEQFLPGDLTVWAFRGGACQEGRWTYEANDTFCFTYGSSGPYCWFMYREGEQIYAEGVGGLLLEIYAVEDAPLSCEAEQLS